MREDEKPIEYFFRMLLEGKLSFTELTEAYVAFLELKKKENQQDLTEASVLVAVMEKPILWMGTKKELNEKIDKFLNKTGVFKRDGEMRKI